VTELSHSAFCHFLCLADNSGLRWRRWFSDIRIRLPLLCGRLYWNVNWCLLYNTLKTWRPLRPIASGQAGAWFCAHAIRLHVLKPAAYLLMLVNTILSKAPATFDARYSSIWKHLSAKLILLYLSLHGLCCWFRRAHLRSGISASAEGSAGAGLADSRHALLFWWRSSLSHWLCSFREISGQIKAFLNTVGQFLNIVAIILFSFLSDMEFYFIAYSLMSIDTIGRK